MPKKIAITEMELEIMRRYVDVGVVWILKMEHDNYYLFMYDDSVVHLQDPSLIGRLNFLMVGRAVNIYDMVERIKNG